MLLNNKNAYQPDILFIANENLYKLKEQGFFGAPDLVVEILSPATRRFDKGEKKAEYERSGVKEYWIIDPADNSTEGFILQEGKFVSIPGNPREIIFRSFALQIAL